VIVVYQFNCTAIDRKWISVKLCHHVICISWKIPLDDYEKFVLAIPWSRFSKFSEPGGMKADRRNILLDFRRAILSLSLSFRAIYCIKEYRCSYHLFRKIVYATWTGLLCHFMVSCSKKQRVKCRDNSLSMNARRGVSPNLTDYWGLNEIANFASVPIDRVARLLRAFDFRVEIRSFLFRFNYEHCHKWHTRLE